LSHSNGVNVVVSEQRLWRLKPTFTNPNRTAMTNLIGQSIPLHSVGMFILYLGLGIALLTMFVQAFIALTPYDDRAEIEKGNPAPAIALTGAMIGFALPLASAGFVGRNVFAFIEWAVISGIVQLAVCKAMMHWLPARTKLSNTASAIEYAGAAVSVGILSALAMVP
jgi:putative membrane protein